MGQNKFIDVFGVGLECPFEKLPESGTLMRDGNIFIVFSLDKIREEEICYFQNGQWWFSLRQEQGHIVLASKLKLNDQSPPWIFEVMFSLNKTHRKDREAFLSIENGQAYPIHFLLVDKKTNIIKAMRLFGLSARANKFLKDNFLEQATQEPCSFDISKLPSPRKSFDSGLIKEKAGTK